MTLARPLLFMPLAALVNPFAIAGGIWLVSGHAVHLDPNVAAIPFRWLAPGCVAAWLVIAAPILAGSWLICGRRVSWQDLIVAYTRSQWPFAPHALLTWLITQGLEGNIIGFIIVPGSLGLLFFTGPAAGGLYLKTLLRLRRGTPDPESRA